MVRAWSIVIEERAALVTTEGDEVMSPPVW
jgi:hypothetical protein